VIRLLLAIGAIGVIGAALAAPVRPAASQFNFIDLQPKANKKLADNFGGGQPGNNLASVPKGEETFAEIKFKVGDGLLHLDSGLLAQRKAVKIDGIVVDRMLHKLHFLHGTVYGYGSGPNLPPGAVDPKAVADNTPIAEYRIHYTDGESATVPVVYGKDVRDWWVDTPIAGDKPVTRGKLAWTGDNPSAKEKNRRIRIYRGVWENPKPEKRIANIDFVKIGESVAAPFCLAITAED
jgi:hypothetical protein